MNSEEIKKTYSMRDILGRYGMQPNRAGFICCPFHKEKTASMKIYQDSYYCFGCGAHGDIFDFVSQMEERRKVNSELIDIYRDCLILTVPLSDLWTESYNKLQYQLYLHEVLNEPR